MEVKPLSKNDLNKWFEKCVTRLEKDPEIAITQREKLEKTKENIAKMAMKEQNLN